MFGGVTQLRDAPRSLNWLEFVGFLSSPLQRLFESKNPLLAIDGDFLDCTTNWKEVVWTITFMGIRIDASWPDLDNDGPIVSISKHTLADQLAQPNFSFVALFPRSISMPFKIRRKKCLISYCREAYPEGWRSTLTTLFELGDSLRASQPKLICLLYRYVHKYRQDVHLYRIQ